MVRKKRLAEEMAKSTNKPAVYIIEFSNDSSRRQDFAGRRNLGSLAHSLYVWTSYEH